MAAFFDDMEWTARQQVWFLLQSICLGLVQGVIFDTMTGAGKRLKPIFRLCLDAAYGPIAGLLLFFGSLVIMDGQLHPLLLVGSALGVVIEHVTVGTYLSKSVAFICRMLQTMVVCLEKTYVWILAHVRKIVLMLFIQGRKRRKRAQNAEKIPQ